MQKLGAAEQEKSRGISCNPGGFCWQRPVLLLVCPRVSPLLLCMGLSVNPWPLGHHLPRPGCAPFSMGNRSCSLGLSSVFGFCAAGGGFEALASLQQAREVIGAGRGPLLPLLLLQSRVTGRCQEFCKPQKEEMFPGQGQRAWGPLEHPLLSPSCPSLPGPRSGTCNLELFLNACSSSRLAPCCSAGFKRCAWSGAHPSPWKTQISFFLI